MPYKSYSEYLKHPLFLAVKSIAYIRSCGLCELCGCGKAVDPHHVRYPKWGTFDVPENLIYLCRKCHCFLHGKDK